MQDKIIVGLRDVWHQLKPSVISMSVLGIDTKGLLQYALEYAVADAFARHHDQGYLQQLGYHNLVAHLEQDLNDTMFDRMMDPAQRRQTIHKCLDFIQQASAVLVAQIERTYGPFDHTLAFDQYLGQDMVLSLKRVHTV